MIRSLVFMAIAGLVIATGGFAIWWIAPTPDSTMPLSVSALMLRSFDTGSGQAMKPNWKVEADDTSQQ